jgi:hypothetical protein
VPDESPRAEGRPVELVAAKPSRNCVRAVLNEVIEDNRIDGAYSKRCYEAVLERLPADHYGVGSIRNPIEEKLSELEAE